MTYTHDVIVIGAGAAGLTAAGGAAMFGLKVALIEEAEMGGECLNTGCVPSKALLAAAARAQSARDGVRLGVALGIPDVDFSAVRAHVNAAILAIAPHDSQERFEGLGVDVIRTRAQFLDRTTIQAGNRRLRAPRFVVATGSKPRIPDIPGLTSLPFLTNENLFELDILPEHLLILGAGAVGFEMAQAYRRLGSRVTVVAPGAPLGRDDPDAVALVTNQLRIEGVVLELGREVIEAKRTEQGVSLVLDDKRSVAGSHLLVAAGRVSNIQGLELAAAGVEAGKDGIVVDARRRSSNKRIYAIGDCRAGPRFTHVSGYEGALVAADLALGIPGKVDWRALPHVTYTDPELAQIGVTETEARERYGRIDVIREDFSENDRAVAEGDVRGFMKLVRYRGKVIGVTIVGAHAGDLLEPWSQVITGRTSTFALGSAVIAYPTRSEITKAAAFAAHEPLVFGAWPKRWAQLISGARRLRG
ncbi:FAD-dependent oxidoreductase [Sphingomonas sp. TREG-RG-20F-R18-01]|uniref:dihydrolipoyl dehydrogenase family protein n=1 Tax=Sphingomonas sp. TREG-RG-20F-R18-01 TaxID=2914982 RepID=UPI001F59AC80|nr:FAD-dependent oxidoreductase [Sphingomonas sp. TREG-RG-20F-R18-01]